MSRSLILLPLLFAPFWSPVSDAPGSQKSAPPTADAPTAPPKGHHQVKLNGHTFTLPDGFTIELAAGADLAPRPIAAAFDEKGRLYVTDSSGSNEKVAIQLEKKPHRVLRLEDTNGDGTFDKQTVYVPNIMFPEGCMYLNGSVYVAAPPHIWKFTDTDDDGKADKEEIWFDGKTLTGCANDLHGPYLGPDGWIYWCKGAFAQQEYTLPNGKKFTTKASHIFRATPDGRNIEPVMTGGMDNPVDVVFTPSGERIFSCTFLQRPADGKRDGLIHAVYGAVYGKDHPPVYEHPWTHPTLMPPMTHLGPAAPCGLHRYESDQFGKDYENNLFCCQFNMRKVSRHVLVPTGSTRLPKKKIGETKEIFIPDGATYTTQDSDFVVSDNLDFHPTDVIEDADGSLLIVDTGGWYKLCCPTSQLVKPDVTGGIYRVKKVGSHKVNDPRGEKMDWKAKPDELVDLLGDRRPAVRQRAMETIAAFGDAGMRALYGAPTHPTSVVWRNAVWTACRIDSPTARHVCRQGLRSDDKSTVLASLHAISLWRDKDSSGMMHQKAGSKDRSIRRALAEASGRIGGPVIGGLGQADDRVLEHSITYALIEVGDRDVAARYLKSSPRARRIGLMALEQMPDGKLEAKDILGDLDSPDPELEATTWWIAGRHSEWSDELAGYFHEQLRLAHKFTDAARQELTERLAKFAKNLKVQDVIAEAVRDGSPEGRIIGLRVMAFARVEKTPDIWVESMAAVRSPELLAEVLAAARALPLTYRQYRTATSFLNFRLGLPEPTLQIMSAAPPGTSLEQADAKYVLSRVDRARPPSIRSLASEVLTRYRLADAHFIELSAALKTVDPVDLPKLLPIFSKSKDQKVGLALVAALTDPKIRPAIRVEQVKPILDKYPKPVRDEAEKLYALLAEARKDETAKLEGMLKTLPAGDVRRGQVVFNGTKAQCIACHKMGYVGGLTGPDLTRIGGIRTERDLLESIVFPSASFVRSYEPVRVVTLDGRSFSGILKSETPDEIVLTVAADKEERIPRADVESMTPSAISVMPAGLDQQLTPQELADLVAFLKASK